jgi:RHS repeat-associated protein
MLRSAILLIASVLFFAPTAQAQPYQARFVTQNVPATMIAGQQYAVTVTMLNTGTDTWTQAAAYRLGSQNGQDNLTWGLGRVDVPTSVGPSQLVTFSFLVTAPATPGTYNFQWRMVQDGVTWFGDFTPNQAVNIALVGTDTVWVEDALPVGATPAADGGDSWNWVNSNPLPYSGALAHQSALIAGAEHQHYFYNATATLSVAVGDSLFSYVYLDPANPPQEVMLQWNDGSWEHRAYWGANLVPWGADGTVARHYMGALPTAGQWVRLEVAASVVGLEGSTLNGMAYTLSGGQLTWDRAGKSSAGTLQSQTISFGALANQTLGAAPFTVSATASSGLPVTFSSLTSSMCTVSGSTVTMAAVGTCTIQASQAGNANYSAAPDVDRSFQVTSGAGTDTVWVEDALPAGATPAADGGDRWTWISSNPSPYSGALAHQSGVSGAEHQHYFYNATATLSVGVGDSVFSYVYLDPANPPSEVMLQWNDGSWEHRAYWGANLVPWGADGTVARHYMGPLPAVGQWVRLSVPASLVGLEGSTLNGMAFTLSDGRATWDYAGKTAAGGAPLPPAPTALMSFTPASIATGASSLLSVTLNPKLLYVANYSDNTVSVVNSATNTLLATIPVGTNPYFAAANPGGSRVYVSNISSNNVSVLDTASNAVIATIAVGVQPTGIAVSPTSNVAYVTNFSGATVSVLNTTTNSVSATVAAGTNPINVAMNPAGTRAYVSNYGSNTVSVFDTASNTVIATVPVGANPRGLAVNPAGSLLYVSNAGSNTVSVVNTVNNTVVATVAVGAYPLDVTVNPAGSRAYVSNYSSNSVSLLDTASNAVVATVAVGTNPVGVALNPAATKAYVANFGANTLSVIDIASNTVSGSIVVGNSPLLLASSIVAPFASATTGVTVTDIYPVGLVNISNAVPTNSCGGTAAVTSNGSGVGLFGGTIPANDSCIVTVNVTSAVSGTYVNNTSPISTANAGTGAAASATLTVVGVNQPPTVVLNAPANNSTYNAPATIALAATATDSDGTVSKVDFYQNGAALGTVTTGGPGNTGSSYSFTWNSVGVGTYALVARAYDNVGATRDSPTVNVNVCGPPTVALTAPPDGQSMTSPGSFTLSATANTPAPLCPTISRVEFYKNGTLITTVTTAPYTYQWTNVAVGDYAITAIVYDSSGATATSAPVVTVHVTPAGSPPTVTLTAPSPGQVVPPGTVVTVTANPIADTAHGRNISNVVLAAKNASGTVVWSVTTYPCTTACGGPLYTATWTTGAAGIFTFTATVTDSVGSTGVSPPITLTVDVPPTVSVTSDASSYPTPATVHLTATATSTVTTIQSVAFYANGSSIGSGTPGAGSTYTLTWLNNVVGTYSVTATATDNLNVSTTSSAITIAIVPGGPSTVYYHNDFAGSPLAATDQSGAVLWSESYAPYGERYLNQDTTTRNGVWFAGKPTEDSSGLSYFGGRWYNPMVGRFYSADPQRFRDDIPLSFNRYAYGNNNPYRFADLNGHSPIDIGFLVWDLGKLGVALYNGSGGGEAAIDVGISAIAVIIPVPGSGLAIKSARAAKAFAEGAKAADAAQMLRQGELAADIAATFREGRYQSHILQSDVEAFRFSGGTSGATGRFLTTQQTVRGIATPEEAIRALNLPPGATAEQLNAFIVPKGTRIFYGRVEGGGATATQIFIQDSNALRAVP